MATEPDSASDDSEDSLPLDEEELELDESEVDDPTAAGESRFRELGAAAELGDIFQRVTQLLPSDQDLLVLAAGTSALDGLRELGRHNYSQAPVTQGVRCIGVFSYRSFARAVAAFPESKSKVAEIAVEDCLEQLPCVRLDDNIEDILGALDRNDALLVGEPTRPIAIVSPLDVLYYLYSIANGYVLMRQIELALRHVIRISTTAETFAACVASTLEQKYGQQGRNSPSRLEDMDFSDVCSLVNSGRTWQYFTTVLGENHDLVKTRLAPLRDIRNALFHFRRPISVEEYETLAISRNWLLLRLELCETPGGDLA